MHVYFVMAEFDASYYEYPTIVGAYSTIAAAARAAREYVEEAGADAGLKDPVIVDGYDDDGNRHIAIEGELYAKVFDLVVED